MFVCQCAAVTDRDIAQSIANGARGLAEICRTTSAGRTCGRCVPTLRELVCQHCPIPARQQKAVTGAAR